MVESLISLAAQIPLTGAGPQVVAGKRNFEIRVRVSRNLVNRHDFFSSHENLNFLDTNRGVMIFFFISNNEKKYILL